LGAQPVLSDVTASNVGGRTGTEERDMKPFILFVCKHNTGRSQMAEAYLRQLAGDSVEVASAGTIAAERPDSGVVAIMAEDGIDISAARPKLLDPVVVRRADRIITMGCDVEGVPRIDADWGLPDPKGQPPERLREIRDLVKQNVIDLIADQLAIAFAPIPGITNAGSASNAGLANR
jgi:arsenate reductase